MSKRGFGKTYQAKRAFVLNFASKLPWLPAREQTILKMHYGLENIPTHTLKEIGEKFDVSGEMIRIVEAKAFQKLKNLSKT